MGNDFSADEREIDPRIDLAVRRTELAMDRTLLAWIRTALALMGAGIAFDKGAQFMHQARMSAGTALVQSSHVAGLGLTGVSTLLLVLVTLNHMTSMRDFARMKDHAPRRVTPVVIAAVLVILLGGAVLTILFLTNG